jgi:ribosomal protein S12 methylthiotransferase
MLRRMRREVDGEGQAGLLRTLRKRLPGIAIRTHFIVGFPGETDEDFEELLNRVSEEEWDHVGCFAYSREDGTPAGRMKEQVPERVKVERRRRLLEAQQAVAARVWGRWVGREAEVRIDSPAPRPGQYVGRLEQQGYEVDGVTRVRASAGAPSLRVGEKVRVRIMRARRYDLEAEVIG